MLQRRFAASWLLAVLLPCLAAPVAADVAAAKRFWGEGQLREAGLTLKEYLSDRPDDVDARVLLARVYLDLYQGDAAEKELRKALSAGAARSRVLAPLARALLLQGAYERVLEEVAVAVVAEPAQRAELGALRGEAHLGLQNRNAARSEYERALAMQPTQLDALLGTARLALMDRRVDEARRILVAAAEQHLDDARVWELLAEVDYAEGDYAAAEQSLVKAVIVGRNKWMPRFKRSLARLQLGKLDEAAADIDAVAEEFPTFPGLLYARGALLLRQGELDDGLASLDAYLRYDPDNVRVLYLSAIGEMQRGNLVLAADLLRKYLELLPDSVPATRALALVWLRQRNATAAEKLLRKSLAARPDRPELLLVLAQALEEQGRWEEARDPLLRVVELVPDAAEYRVAAAETLQRLGDYDAALEQLDTVLALDPLHRAAPLMKVKILLEQQEPKEALALAETLVSARRDDPYALNALGLAQIANGSIVAARASFTAALDADPEFPDAALNLAKLALRDGDTQAARRLLEQVVAAAPSHVEAILALAELDAYGGDVRAEQRRLREALDALPDEPRLRLALARSYLSNGKPELARVLVQSASERIRQQPELMLVMGQAQAAVGDFDAAVQTLQALQLRSADSATPHFLLAAVYAEQGNAPAMEKALIAGASMAPDSPLLHPAIERGLELYKDPAQELALLDRLLAASDAHPRLTVVKADLLVEMGEYARAERLMRALFERYPDDTGVMRELVSVQRAGNALADAEQVLEDWLARYPDDAASSVMLAQVQAELGKTDIARQSLEALMAAGTAFQSDPLVLNNLAWLLRDADPERALGYAERALRADPTSAAIKDTLGILLVQAGELARGLDLLEQARQAEPADATIGYHYALALSKLDRDAEARVILLGLLSRDFPERDAARALLAEVGG
jgi:putative PEP-CTERM system TPR-repeat lipoprotein